MRKIIGFDMYYYTGMLKEKKTASKSPSPARLLPLLFLLAPLLGAFGSFGFDAGTGLCTFVDVEGEGRGPRM